MTYSELQAAILNWCHRSDLTSIIPTWIRFATAGFNRVLRTPEMEARDTSTLTDEYTALPADFLEVIAVADSAGRQLRHLDRQQFGSLVASGREPNVPIFTIEDYQLRLWPAPTASASLTVTLLYYEQISTLVNANDTNWLLTDHPDLYLYGALMHGRVWMQGDERIPLIKGMYDEMLSDVRRRRVVATGVNMAVGSDVPLLPSAYDITRG